MSIYGLPIRSSEFSLDERWALTNNGSVGVTPNAVIQERRMLLEQYEANPDCFVRKILPKMWLENLHAACEYLALPYEQCVLVDNTTTGINDILNSFPFRAGDGILTTSLVYGAVQFTCESVASKQRLELIKFHIRFPVLSRQELAEQFDQLLTAQKGRIRLAILEAIASCSAARLPLDELVTVARRHNVAVLIDGAHACGQLQNTEVQSLCELSDFFVTSLHKWMFTARSAGLLYVNAAYLGDIRPAITSWGYANRSNFHALFSSMGTKDYTPLLTIGKAIEFRKKMDALEEAGLMSYNKTLVDNAAKRLSKCLGTEELQFSSNSFENTHFLAPFMRNILLPEVLQRWFLGAETPIINVEHNSAVSLPLTTLPFDGEAIRERCQRLILALYERYMITSTFVDVDETMYVRISSQIYNCSSDYERLGHALKDITELIIEGKFEV